MKRSENGLVPVSTQAKALFHAMQVEDNGTRPLKRGGLEILLEHEPKFKKDYLLSYCFCIAVSQLEIDIAKFLAISKSNSPETYRVLSRLEHFTSDSRLFEGSTTGSGLTCTTSKDGQRNHVSLLTLARQGTFSNSDWLHFPLSMMALTRSRSR